MKKSKKQELTEGMKKGIFPIRGNSSDKLVIAYLFTLLASRIVVSIRLHGKTVTHESAMDAAEILSDEIKSFCKE